MRPIMKKVFIVLIFLVLIACSSAPDFNSIDGGVVNTKVEVDKMSKVLFVIAHKDFQDKELLVPKHLLEANHEVLIASTETTAARGVFGAEFTPDIDLDEALNRIDEFDAVVFVGGPGAKVYFDDYEAHKIALNARNVLAAICIAPVTLAKAGVLDGKKATVWDDGQNTQKNILKSNGAVIVDEPVVVDGNLITANGPDAAQAFGEKISELLG